MSSRFIAWLFAASLSVPALSGPQLIDSLQAQFKSAGASEFSAERGKTLWTQEITNSKGETHACTNCHGKDLTQPGQHAKTKKTIKPMAMSVNKARFSDEKKVEKWFKRNCKWTWGRECTPQEQGDILEYMRTL